MKPETQEIWSKSVKNSQVEVYRESGYTGKNRQSTEYGHFRRRAGHGLAIKESTSKERTNSNMRKIMSVGVGSSRYNHENKEKRHGGGLVESWVGRCMQSMDSKDEPEQS